MDNFHGKGDFELLEIDILRSSVNEIPSIHLSKWVNQIIIKDMACTVVTKLLGRSIGYSMLYNKYLMVQPQTVDFNTTQPYPSMVMEWIRLLGLSRNMHYGHVKEFCPNRMNRQKEMKKEDANVERRGWRPSRTVKGNNDEERMGPFELDLEKRVGVANMGFRQQWPTKDNSLLLGPRHHRPAQREVSCKERMEGNKGVGLERVMSGGKCLNELIARVTELKDSHLVQGSGAPREARLLFDPLELAWKKREDLTLMATLCSGFGGLQELLVTPTERILDPRGHSVLVFKENIQLGSLTSASKPTAMGFRTEPEGLRGGGGKNNGNKKNRKLNKAIKNYSRNKN
ncbi:hypothetical protein Gorai_000174 [Gossypium raimondii]|uniref:DUF4283 domain-containing protein n=1 Tax=Gossypium raimondii TaxID=29730 RepID=A0A7J8PCN9_GOSRA|nr:hypothetical protein [Gossypium raimondii]